MICLDFYDGPLSGLAKCGTCGREYLFENLDEDGGGDVRIVSVAPLPPGSIQSWVNGIWKPRPIPGPIWVPIWSWPDQATAQAKTAASDAICEQAADPLWVIAWKIGEPTWILKVLKYPAAAQGLDWFAFSGVKRPPKN